MSDLTRVFGPDFRSKLDLMGIRFGDAGGDGGGAGGDGGDGGGDKGGGDGGESSYKAPATQADLDRIVEERLARERKKFEGHDDFKAKAAKWDELEDGKKTPDQKAIDEARDTAAKETASRYERRIAGSEIKAIASTLGFLDPADALTVLPEQLPMKDDELDVDALKKLVEKLASDKPYLVKEQSRAPRQRQKAAEGEKQDDGSAGKGKAAAALRTFGKSRDK